MSYDEFHGDETLRQMLTDARRECFKKQFTDNLAAGKRAAALSDINAQLRYIESLRAAGEIEKARQALAIVESRRAELLAQVEGTDTPPPSDSAPTQVPRGVLATDTTNKKPNPIPIEPTTDMHGMKMKDPGSF